MGFDFVATTLVILSYFNCVSCAHYWWNILLIEVHCYSDFNIILSLACAEMVVFLRSVSNLLSPCFSAASTSRKMIEIVATWKHLNIPTNLQARYDLFCVKSAVKPQPTNQPTNHVETFRSIVHHIMQKQRLVSFWQNSDTTIYNNELEDHDVPKRWI